MNHQILREVLGIPVSDEDLEAFDARKESLFRTLCRPALRPIGGLMEFLSDARRQGIRMALATAAGKANREFTLDGLGVTAYFDAVVGAEDVRSGKPDPEIFLRAAERVGAAPSSCVVFEDALSGVEAAARAGMKAVAMTTSLTAGEFAGHPAVIRIADDYTSLRPQAILRLARGPQPA
jgi:HAD superfamily hydrolase (TIGR01509 family)